MVCGPVDCLVYCDDDDVLVKEGIDKLHSMKPDKGKVHLFCMRMGNNICRPDNIGLSEISGAQVVPPNVNTLPYWMQDNEYAADLYFIKRCSELFTVVRHEEVLVEVRPTGA
jgi:hypothetical protein